MKSLTERQKKKDKYRVPRKVQDLIPIQRIWRDGVFQVGSDRYSKTYMFSDINYQASSEADKSELLLNYRTILGGFDSSADVKITVNNRGINGRDFERDVLMDLKGDGYDEYRREYNKVLSDKAVTANGIVQEKYITLTVSKRSVEDARAFFSRISSNLQARLAEIGSKCIDLNASERLRILHDFYRSGEETEFHFDIDDMMRKGHDFRDYICPDSIERHSDYMMIGGKYARVVYLKDYASAIRDDVVALLTDFKRKLLLSVDFVTVPTDVAVREVEKRLLGIEANVANWQRRQNERHNFSAVVPYEMEQQRASARDFLNDLTTRDLRMILGVITMVMIADTKEQLDADTESVMLAARERMCQMAVLRYQQTDGLITTLPIGDRRIDAMRTFTSETLAAFVPFRVQEIQEKGGIHFGENAISHNLILCNMNNLLNQSMIVLGVPGSGKSFFTKKHISTIALSSRDDDIIICDPEGEYSPLVRALGGSVIEIAAGGKDHINAMDMVEGYGEKNPLVEKSQFLMSLVEQIDKAGVGAHHKSIIDRCAEIVYREAKENGTVPTLCQMRKILSEQPEKEAKDLALALELYTEGSLNIFAHETNVDTTNRIVSYDIHELGSQLKPAGLLVITDAILNRVSYNWKHGKRTHIIIDEFQVVFEDEYGGMFFTSAWRQFRKRNSYPCAITQNVEYLLDSVDASTMLSNSEILVMFRQAAQDLEKLGDLLSIPPEQMNYVSSSSAGCGLLKYGSVRVPFESTFPRDTLLYKLISTKPSDGYFTGKNE